MNFREKLSELMMAFCVCTTCINLMQGLLGMLFYPEDVLHYDAFFIPLIFAAFSVLLGVVTWSKRELPVKEVLIRRGIHLLLIEGMVFGINYATGNVFPIQIAVLLAFGIAFIFVMVYVILWVNDKRSADSFNQKLKQYQQLDRE